MTWSTHQSLSLSLSLIAGPSFILTSTVAGGILGYLAHRYEENSEERVKLLLEKHRHAPVEWAKMTTNDVPEGERMLHLHTLDWFNKVTLLP